MMPKSTIVATLRKILVFLVVVAAVGVLLKRTVLAPPPVELVSLSKRDLAAMVYGNGTVEAKVVVAVASKIGGRLLAVTVDQGDEVRRGQVLARLETDELEEQLRQAKASLERVTAQVGLERANLRKTQASLALAEKNAGRFTGLAAQDLVAKLEGEQYATAWQVAREEAGRAEAAVTTAEREVTVANAAVGVAQSRLDDAVILAPDDGVIIRRDLEPGATVAAGLPILQLADPRTVWVKANVDEAALRGVVAGLPATITLRSAPGEEFPGQVARLAWESDRVTEELEVDVAFTPARKSFRLGEQAEVLITTATRQAAPSLPASAVVSRAGRRGVWTVIDGRLRFREVATGLVDRQGVTEITSGLTGNEVIALASLDQMPGLTDGQQVRVKK